MTSGEPIEAEGHTFDVFRQGSPAGGYLPVLVVDDGASGEWDLQPDQARELARRLVQEAACSEFLDEEQRARAELAKRLRESSLDRAIGILTDLGYAGLTFVPFPGAEVAGRLPDGCEFVLDLDDEVKATLRVDEPDGSTSEWALQPELPGEWHVRGLSPYDAVGVLRELNQERISRQGQRP